MASKGMPKERVGLGGSEFRQRSRLHQPVASAYEDRILSGVLPVGECMPSEGEIAREYGVSTRSVREAMQILETKGLVRRRHGGRSVVVRDDVGGFLDTLASTVRQLFSTDPAYLMQLMVARRMIETEVVGILTSRREPTAPAVGEALVGMATARDTEDFAGFVEADARFHLALVHSADNKILSVFYDNLYGLIMEVIRVTSRVPTKSLDDAYDEHADIFAHIARGNEVKAKKLLRSQIDNSSKYLQIAIEHLRFRPDIKSTGAPEVGK